FRSKRLENILLLETTIDLFEEIDEDYESTDELQDEWNEEDEEIDENIAYTPQDLVGIENELEDLKRYRDLANVIRKNSKAEHLFTALEKGFKELERLGANNKALIFTESRRTQDFLYNTLEERGFQGKVVLFNGMNNDAKSKEIYKSWLNQNKGSDKVYL